LIHLRPLARWCRNLEQDAKNWEPVFRILLSRMIAEAVNPSQRKAPPAGGAGLAGAEASQERAVTRGPLKRDAKRQISVTMSVIVELAGGRAKMKRAPRKGQVTQRQVVIARTTSRQRAGSKQTFDLGRLSINPAATIAGRSRSPSRLVQLDPSPLSALT
jgi:hypothetical protein